jgi:hypothetical protein
MNKARFRKVKGPDAGCRLHDSTKAELLVQTGSM